MSNPARERKMEGKEDLGKQVPQGEVQKETEEEEGEKEKNFKKKMER